LFETSDQTSGHCVPYQEYYPITTTIYTLPLEEVEKKVESTYSLYRVYVISKKEKELSNNKKGRILLNKTVIARSTDEACFLLSIHLMLKENGLTLNDVTIIYDVIGHVEVEEDDTRG
jgi:hypothetical protein